MRKLAAALLALALFALPSTAEASGWHYERMTWYGPHFYGNRTACGQRLTHPYHDHGLRGVANRTLPCGTRVTVCVKHRCVRTRVVDRGPYGVSWHLDLTAQTDIDLVGRPAHTIRRGHWRVGW
jgi:rare lipoprotein A (peptidoglycan hydrolase)